MYDIITIGEILAEFLTEKQNQELSSPGTLFGPFPSGAPAIAIDQAGRMGAKTAIIAKIGEDDFGLLNKTRLDLHILVPFPVIGYVDKAVFVPGSIGISGSFPFIQKHGPGPGVSFVFGKPL